MKSRMNLNYLNVINMLKCWKDSLWLDKVNNSTYNWKDYQNIYWLSLNHITTHQEAKNNQISEKEIS